MNVSNSREQFLDQKIYKSDWYAKETNFSLKLFFDIATIFQNYTCFEKPIYSFIPFIKKVSGLLSIQLCTATLASDEKYWPLKTFFTFENNQKFDHDYAILALYGGCETAVNFISLLALFVHFNAALCCCCVQ